MLAEPDKFVFISQISCFFFLMSLFLPMWLLTIFHWLINNNKNGTRKIQKKALMIKHNTLATRAQRQQQQLCKTTTTATAASPIVVAVVVAFDL